MSVLFGFPRARVYIAGARVTQDVQRIQFNRTDDGKTPGSVQITLASPDHRYTMTEADILRLAVQRGDYDVNDAVALKIAAQTVAEARSNAALEGLQTISELLFRPGEDEEERRAAEERYRADLGVMNEVYHEAKAAALRAAAARPEDVLAGVRDDEIAARIEAEVHDELKRKVLLSKFRVTTPVEQPPVVAAGSLEARLALAGRGAYLQYRGVAARYPFYMGRTIFHANDPVTIFLRDPFEPTTWHWAFRGQLANRGTTHGADQDERVVLTAQGPLRLLYYARMATNPGILDVKQVKQAEDFVSRSFRLESFANLTLEEYLFTMVFGPGAVGTTDRLGLTEGAQREISAADPVFIERRNLDGVVHRQEVNRYAVGAFDLARSRVVVFGPDSEAPSPTPAGGRARLPIFGGIEMRIDGERALEEYQTLVDSTVTFADVFDMRLPGTGRPGLPLSSNSPRDLILDVMDEIGQNPQYYPVDGGRLILLAPASLGPDLNRDVLTRDFLGAIPTKTDFKSRLEMIYQVLSRLEFRLHESPKGDILIEMPLCDFSPRDFGVYADRYRLTPLEITGDDTTENDDRVRTQIRGKWNLLPNMPSAGDSGELGKWAVETLRGLVPLYGVRLEESEPPVWMASEEGARLLAQLRLNMINAEAISSQLSHAPNVAWTPNRPVEWAAGGQMMTLRTCSITLDYSGSGAISASSGFNYTRLWDGSVSEDGQRLYAPIGGAPGKSFDYGVLFSRRGRTPKGA